MFHMNKRQQTTDLTYVFFSRWTRNIIWDPNDSASKEKNEKRKTTFNIAESVIHHHLMCPCLCKDESYPNREKWRKLTKVRNTTSQPLTTLYDIYSSLMVLFFRIKKVIISIQYVINPCVHHQFKSLYLNFILFC